jgi:hypothetical protein
MAAVVTAQANKLIDTILVTAAPTLSVTGISTRLTTTSPTASSAGTELTGGSGYTTGGTTTITVLTWTNASGGSWSIVGIELWDQAGTPIRWLFGLWTGQPVSIANGNTFQVAAGAVTVSLT